MLIWEIGSDMTPMRFSMVRTFHCSAMRLDLFFILVLSCVVIIRPAMAQNRPQRIVSGDFQRFDVDNLGNIYAITRNNQLKKYTPDGDSVGVFNDLVRFGRLRTMDVSNPLRILLFYPDFGTILFLDRMLKPIDAIDLRRLSMMQVSVAATSYDNHCWIYDDQEARLRKLDVQGRILLESPDLRMLMDDVPHPVLLSDQQGTVSMYDQARGFYLFDLYGAFQQWIPMKGWTNSRVNGGFLEGLCAGQLMRYELKTGRITKTDPPINSKDIRQIVFLNAGLYVLDGEGVIRTAHQPNSPH